MKCDMELCPHWNGDGCPCEVLDLDKPLRRGHPDCLDDVCQATGTCIADDCDESI